MERRNFIKNTTLAALALSLPVRLLASDDKNLKNWLWTNNNAKLGVDKWKRKLAFFKKNGIDAVLLGADYDSYKKIAKIAPNEGVELHSWIWTLNRGSEELMNEHKDWYAVNRNGESVIDKPPYVNYYRWLCPSKQEVSDYIRDDYIRFASIEGLAGVHLDYVRFCDVILPIALQPKYNLVQDHEMPQYDFCYCETCRTKFKQQYGVDPMKLENPAENKQWIQFRYDAVSNVVKNIVEGVHNETGKPVTAAVFPTPDIARKLVRQEWNKWPLDAIMPMIYHSFYNKDIQWIKTAAAQGVEAINGRFPHYTGLFIPFFKQATELTQAVELAIEAGSEGVAIFNENAMTRKYWREFKAVVK